MGFSLIHGDSTLGLDTLGVNDLTLWKSKISEAISSYSTIERKFITKQKSGNTLPESSVTFSQSSQHSAHENETKESRGRLLLIIVKGEKIDDPNGRKQALTLSIACFVQCLFF